MSDDPPETMRAQVVENFGGPDVFRRKTVPRPKPRPNHVLVRVRATSVNPLDCTIRAGAVEAFAPGLPAVLHGDVAGTVEAVGPGVTEFDAGDAVYGCAGGVRGLGGALAEYMLADADLIAHKPNSLSMREAAALPLVTVTAWEGIVDRADVRPGQNVLVHGATGGVGHVAVQIAKLTGAIVHGTASTDEKRAIACDLGADEAIDYRERSVEEYVEEFTNGDGYDVVFDTVGSAADNLQRSLEAIGLNGQVVTTLARSTEDLGALQSKGASFHVVTMLIPLLHGTGRDYHGDILTRVAALVDNGDIRPLLDDERFTLDDIADAHRRVESGDHVGKVTVTLDAESDSS